MIKCYCTYLTLLLTIRNTNVGNRGFEPLFHGSEPFVLTIAPIPKKPSILTNGRDKNAFI